MYIDKLIALTSNPDILPSESAEPDIGISILLIIVGLFCILIAFTALKFLKITTCISGALIGFSLGMNSFAPILGDAVPQPVVVLLAVALAVLGVILTLKAFKIVVYIYTSYFIYSFFYGLLGGVVEVMLESSEVATAIVSIFCFTATVVISGYFSRYFKSIFIVISSYSYTIIGTVCFIFALLFFNIYNDVAILIIMFLGLILTILSAYTQFKTTQHIDI